jgi:nitroreductase
MNVESKTIERLISLAHTAPSADNTQPWHFVWDEEYLHIKYDSQRVTGKTFPADSPATLLSIGAMIEIMMEAASAWRLDASLELNKDLPDKHDEYARIRIRPGSSIAHSDTLPQPASLRHTNRLAYLKRAIPHEIQTAQKQLKEGNARLSFFTDRKKVQKVAGLLKAASEVRFRTQEVHEWLGRSLRFSKKSVAAGDGLDVATLGLPPGGKLFLRLINSWNRMRVLNKLGIYKLVSAIDAAPVKSAPGLIAIISTSDSKGTIAAGRLLARSWIMLNQSGLAAHPYYVIADQLARARNASIPEDLVETVEQISKSSTTVFTLSEDETLHMLLRVGYAKKQPVLSRRLPLSKVYGAPTG